ncbi:VOC family protein [Arenibacter sp. GZD96]|uniref:VOC family protein n=1 Tax=Aurantibrevibacter litoralis TaxID=3106030 RepID=UPI002AFE6134|nr:VOC family protein [Arenibacter sp. GZD-96]MEA1787000.1 VOC family protein [Arenibacter sp. GZD-96]
MNSKLKKIVGLLCMAHFTFLSAQSFDFVIDHSAIIVNQLEKTGDFYAKVMGLQEIPHPTNSPGFRWFNVQGNSQLHLIYKDTVVMKKHKSMHLCLSTQKLDAFIENLKYHQIPFEDWPGKPNAVTLRADGVQQIYIQDPEGYWIEINDAAH